MLYQCSHCGTVESTAVSKHGHMLRIFERTATLREAMEWRRALGLKPGEPFGVYCSVCSPFGDGTWHNLFPRKVYQLGAIFNDRLREKAVAA